MLTRRTLVRGGLVALLWPRRLWAQPLPPSNLRVNSMAIAFDAASNSGAGTGSTHSWSHTCSWSDRLLLVGVETRNGGVSVSSITYGGEALTFLRSDGTTGQDGRTEIWSKIAPLTGAKSPS